MDAGRETSLGVHVAGLAGTPTRHLSVDGMTPTGPNLSHWPGNRTPTEFKADLSTGICLRFAKAPAETRQQFLAGVEAVVNDHYDTDGFLSMLAVTRPEVALPREAACLAAAATGDYQCFQTKEGFAVDRIVLGLLRSPRSPLAAELEPLSELEREQRCYRWLIAHAEQVLDHPETLSQLWRDEYEVVQDELRRAQRGGVDRRYHAGAQLAVVQSDGPMHRMALNTVAESFRVLHLMVTPEGTTARYHDRTESWFEVVSFTPAARRDLSALRDQLQASEGPAGGGRWCADPPTDPVPELYHGLPEPQAYGEITRTLTPTRLTAAAVEQAVAGFFSS